MKYQLEIKKLIINWLYQTIIIIIIIRLAMERTVEANLYSNMHAWSASSAGQLVVKHVCTLRASSHMDHMRACARHTRLPGRRPFPAGAVVVHAPYPILN